MNTEIDFKDIVYLNSGNNKQKKAFKVLTNNKIISSLKDFSPILIGTIPINIAIENSDLDIICHFTDENYFRKLLIEKFSNYEKFKIYENTSQESLAIVANFFIDDFEIEIFGQDIPTSQQRGYLHMLIEHRILLEKGNDFRKRIIKLKEQGYKTEPAFAHELGLEGDPYEAVLSLDKYNGD
ncbi:DUF4269 domain-containing protein [Flammeovirga kamogawensis]|nr:DUF4269 domain-containing protein [Flammeovirga kamogawensis]